MHSGNFEYLDSCPVCQSPSFQLYLQTPAHMSASPHNFTFCRCEQCQGIFLNPRLKAEALALFYGQHYLPYRGAEAWGKYRTLVEKGLQLTDTKRIRLCRKALKIDTSSRILDVGCGKPTFLQQLHAKTHCQATGVDFSTKGWQDNPWPDLELLEGELQAVSLTPAYDLITMWHYLEHDYQPLASLQYLRKMISPRGRLIIEVPDVTSLSRKWQGKFWEGWHTPRHTVLYSPQTLTQSLQNSGWKVERIYRYGSLDAFTFWWMGRQERKGLNWSASLEKALPSFLLLKALSFPFFKLMEKRLPLGLMTFIARPQ